MARRLSERCGLSDGGGRETPSPIPVDRSAIALSGNGLHNLGCSSDGFTSRVKIRGTTILTSKSIQFTKVCITGGGPAGLATAIAFQQAGVSAQVTDCAIPPVDKACGEGLMPDSIDALSKLGVAMPATAGYRLDGISFFDGQSTVSAPFPNGHGIGLRRTVLHNLLLKRAQDLGVAFRWGVKHGAEETSESGRPLFVAADGHNSTLRREGNLGEVASETIRYGFRRHFPIAPWSRNVELYWGRGFQIYVTPVRPDEVCVALISRDKTFRLRKALLLVPQLASRLADTSPTRPELGSISASRRLRRVASESLVTVGDASGSVDAITGQGMCLAFRQGLALAQLVQAGDLGAYSRAHARIRRLPAIMSELMLTLARHPALQARALSALAKHPAAFASLVNVHVGESPFVNLCSWPIVSLGIALLGG